MILTCPTCGTQYVVKDGAIPPHGRQVRCASCKHSWHQDPEGIEDETLDLPSEAAVEPVDDTQDPDQAAEEAPAGYAPVEPVAPPPEARAEPLAAPVVTLEGADQPAAGEPPVEPAADEEAYDFSPFADREEEDEPERRSPLLTILLIVLLIGALAAAFWFLAPPEWKQRVGIASATGTPLQLMLTRSDRQKIAPSGNESLSVSGRVINPTDKSHTVPPIRAQLRSRTGQLVYSWTIAPPARTLPPGASATFNSAEVNVPAGGDELTITLG